MQRPGHAGTDFGGLKVSRASQVLGSGLGEATGSPGASKDLNPTSDRGGVHG